MGSSRVSVLIAALALVVMLAGCGGGSSTSASVSSGTSSDSATTSSTTSTSTSSSASKGAKPALAQMELSSSAFAKGAKIPARYTCAGANESPPLTWSKVPSNTSQLLLFALDLEGSANTAIRWAVGNISPSTHSISAGSIPAGAVAGQNSLGKNGWAGICAAKGKPHGIVFLLYALRKKLNLSSGFDARTVQKQLSGNTAGAGLTFGTYQHS